MKKAFKHLFMMLAATMSLTFVACSSDSTEEVAGPNGGGEEPNFPTKVVEAVEAGEVFTLQIEPNMDWVVTVPTETATYFQILDGGNLRYEKRGTAGKHEIQIQVADMQEFDQAHTCVVSMTMNGQTKSIAELTLYPLERYLRVYVAEVDGEENDFVRDEEYQVVYGANAASALELIWPYGTVGYMHYIKVEANFPWTIGGDIPAWVSLAQTSGEAGMGEGFRIDTRWSAYPDENTTEKLLFQDLSGDEIVTVMEFEVSIPGSKDYCELELAEELLFDVNGSFYSSGVAIEGASAIASISSMKGSRIYVLNLDEEGRYTTDTEWVIVNEAAWDASEGDAGMQRRAVNVGCTPNELTRMREAVILALPKTKVVDSAADLLQDGELKAAYEAYVVSNLTQEAVAELEAVYFNDFDYEVATQTYGSGSSWPYLDQFTGWMNEQGTGVETVTYTSNGVSARNNSNSDGNYSDYAGSGANNIFFGKNAWMQIENISLDDLSYTLTFGGEKYLSGSDNVFSTEEFTIRLSADGENWSLPIAYTAPTSVGRWSVGEAAFTLPETTHTLWIRFDAKVESAYRIDDVQLMPSEGGQTITFDGGKIEPEQPKEAVKATILEFLNAAEDDTLYELTGTVSNVVNTEYGNFDLTDETGTVYIYGLCSPEGESKYWAASGVKEGDILTLRTVRTSFQGTPQGKNALYVSHTTPGVEPEPEPEPEFQFDSTDYESGTVTTTDDMEMNFWYPEEAAEQGATMRRVVSGTLYDKFSSYNVPIYWLVYEGERDGRNMCMIENTTNYYKMSNDDKTWLSFEPGDYATVAMDYAALKDKDGNAVQATGSVILYSNATKTRCKYVLVCTFKPE